jgi:hypothetical protein
MDVRSIKMVTGEELIAEVLGDLPDGIRVKNVLVLHTMQGQGGAPTLGFAQWSLVQEIDQELVLLHSSMACLPAKVIEPIAKSYVQNTSSIALPDQAARQILHG